MTYIAKPQHKNPSPGGHKIYNFRSPFLGRIILSDLRMGVEKKDFKEIIHVHCMTYMGIPKHKNPSPGSHELYNFGRPFIGHYYILFSLSDPCPKVKKLFLRNTSILHFLSEILPPLGVES